MSGNETVQLQPISPVRWRFLLTRPVRNAENRPKTGPVQAPKSPVANSRLRNRGAVSWNAAIGANRRLCFRLNLAFTIEMGVPLRDRVLFRSILLCLYYTCIYIRVLLPVDSIFSYTCIYIHIYIYILCIFSTSTLRHCIHSISTGLVQPLSRPYPPRHISPKVQEQPKTGSRSVLAEGWRNTTPLFVTSSLDFSDFRKLYPVTGRVSKNLPPILVADNPYQDVLIQ